MKRTLRNTAALGLIVAMAGQSIAADMLTKVGEGEGRLNIVAWPGYIERGETMKDFDWVTSFEEATGCGVLASSFSR